MKIAIVLSGMEHPLLQERAIAAMLAQRGVTVVLPRPVKPTYGDDGTVKPITMGGKINEVA